MGAGEVVGALGPCIHPECYEFSDADLATVAAAYGDRVRGRTSDGRPALDLPAAVSAALAAGGADRDGRGRRLHRLRRRLLLPPGAAGTSGRQALVVWSAAGR